MPISRLRSVQARKLLRLLEQVRASNPFYRSKLEDVRIDSWIVRALDTGDGDSGDEALAELLSRIPFTLKSELQEDQLAHPPYGSNLTFSLASYTRVHETSGTTGVPLRWLDTPETWRWFVDCWAEVFRGAGLRNEDRVLFPFSFGPFIGFWAAFEAAVASGSFCVPAGGLSSASRLHSIVTHGITLVACTPTYALRLAEVARAEGIDLATSKVRGIVVAGEPGGSIDATRRAIEDAWGARVFDHCGMTEVGPFGFEVESEPGCLRVLESEFITEVLEPEGSTPVEPGAVGELVITNLGRTGSPVLRYRTGDLVRWIPRAVDAASGSMSEVSCSGVLAGGILGRLDDMVFIRGNNVYPSVVEGIVRSFSEVAEYRVVVIESGHLSRLMIELEPVSVGPSCDGPADSTGERGRALAARVAALIRDKLRFQPDVEIVPPGTLPRFELKARRFVRKKAP